MRVCSRLRKCDLYSSFFSRKLSLLGSYDWSSTITLFLFRKGVANYCWWRLMGVTDDRKPWAPGLDAALVCRVAWLMPRSLRCISSGLKFYRAELAWRAASAKLCCSGETCLELFFYIYFIFRLFSFLASLLIILP